MGLSAAHRLLISCLGCLLLIVVVAAVVVAVSDH